MRGLPSLQRIHGKLQHAGKISASAGLGSEEKPEDEKSEAPEKEPAQTNEEKINALKAEMDEAVSTQDFERAAKLRDEIKALEGGDNQ